MTDFGTEPIPLASAAHVLTVPVAVTDPLPRNTPVWLGQEPYPTPDDRAR